MFVDVRSCWQSVGEQKAHVNSVFVITVTTRRGRHRSEQHALQVFHSGAIHTKRHYKVIKNVFIYDFICLIARPVADGYGTVRPSDHRGLMLLNTCCCLQPH